MKPKYVSRYIPVTSDKMEIIKVYRDSLEAELGFKVSYSDAIVHAIKRVGWEPFAPAAVPEKSDE